MCTSALFRRLSAATIVITFAHLLFGNIVSGTGSGMGCGPHWPLCQGQLFPPLSDSALVIEWTHRLLAMLVGLSILAITVVAWRRERDKPMVVGLSTVSLVLVVVVAVFGGITVVLDLPKEISTAHLALGLLLFSLLVVLAVGPHPSFATPLPSVKTGEGSGVRALHRWTLFSAILVYLQAVLGAYVRHSNAGLVLPVLPFLPLFPNLAISPIAHQWSHRLLALIVLGAILVTAAKAKKSGYNAMAIGSVVLVLAQILLGILTVWTTLNPVIAMSHLAGAIALLGLLLVLTVRSWPQTVSIVRASSEGA
jgi:heme A synthase